MSNVILVNLEDDKVPIIEAIDESEECVSDRKYRCKASLLLYIAAGTALLNSVSNGLVVGYYSPAIESMKNASILAHIDWTDEAKSWVASSMAIGALVGSLAAGPIMSRLGPRMALVINNFPYLLGWILVVVGKNLPTIIIGRLFGGFSVGFSSGAVPVYCLEISPVSIRGLLGTSFQTSVNVGILIASIAGTYVNYQWLAVISAVPCIVMPFVMLFFPESPSYLMAKHGSAHSQEVVDALKRLRSEESEIEEELEEMSRQPQGKQTILLSWEQLKTPTIFKPILAALGIMFFQQYSGINSVIYFQLTIFEDSGIKINAHVCAIITSMVLVVATAVSSALVDRFGRKILFYISGAGMKVSLLLLGFYFYQMENIGKSFSDTYGWIALFALMLFLATFSLGYGPIPWMIIPEMTPPEARNFVTAVATSFNWGLVFIITKEFEQLKNVLSIQGAFWFFAIFTGLSVPFVKFLLPETKGKTPQEIQRLFA